MDIDFSFSGYIPRSTIARSYDKSVFSLVEAATLSSKVAVPFSVPTSNECSCCSTSSLAFNVVSVLDFGLCNRYVIIPHFCSALHFPDGL